MYMTGDEIRALSRRIPEIVNATDEELSFWMDDAFDVLNNFCQQDFVYERQTTKQVRATTNTLVYLPKVLSGDVTVSSPDGGVLFSNNPGYAPSNTFEIFPGTFTLGCHSYNRQYPASADAHTLFVTGDWGYAQTSQSLLVDGVNALKAAYEAHRVNTVAHNQADNLNAVLSADATYTPTTISTVGGFDLTGVAILLNELKGVINSHFGDFAVHTVADLNISTLPDVTDESSAWSLLADLKKKFNAHLLDVNAHLEQDTDNRMSAGVDPDSAAMPRAIRRVFLRLVQRIAIRDDQEDIRQMNSVYSNETLGDGYTYDLSNGTLRSLLRPEEAHMLLPYVNRGRVVI